MAVHLLNILPTTTLSFQTPFELLFGHAPFYSHLRVFGCLCYLNLSASCNHKLAPRSTRCIFLGYPHDHRGYRCLDLSTECIIISRHVIFDEAQFPYANAEPRLPHTTQTAAQPISVSSAFFPPVPSPAPRDSSADTLRPSLPTTSCPSPSYHSTDPNSTQPAPHLQLGPASPSIRPSPHTQPDTCISPTRPTFPNRTHPIDPIFTSPSPAHSSMCSPPTNPIIGSPSHLDLLTTTQARSLAHQPHQTIALQSHPSRYHPNPAQPNRALLLPSTIIL